MPTFAWHEVGGAEAYQIQVDDADKGHPADFSSPELDETLAGTEYVLAAGLSAGTYAWRVRAVSGSEVSDWSEGWTFAVPATPPERIKIYLPVVGRDYTRDLSEKGRDPAALGILGPKTATVIGRLPDLHPRHFE
jgi:hypothetical protein